MAGEYQHLAPIYETIGMAAYAEQVTPRLLQFAQQNEWLGRRIVDVGCGTGASMAWFAHHGYTVSGVDNDPDMLNQARNHLNTQSLNASMTEADVRSLDLGERFDMVMAVDVFNELDNIRELETAFGSIFKHLSPDRFFIFDLHTFEGLAKRGEIGETLIYEDDTLAVFEHVVYDYERQTQRIHYDIFEHHNDEFWRRSRASRQLRAFPIKAVATLLKRQNFDIVSILDETLTPYDVDRSRTSRITMIARRA